MLVGLVGTPELGMERVGKECFLVLVGLPGAAAPGLRTGASVRNPASLPVGKEKAGPGGAFLLPGNPASSALLELMDRLALALRAIGDDWGTCLLLVEPASSRPAGLVGRAALAQRMAALPKPRTSVRIGKDSLLGEGSWHLHKAAERKQGNATKFSVSFGV